MSTLSHIRGEGDLTIVEYSDLECPFCKDFQTTMQKVVEQYSGKVRWAYKHLPLSRHPKAQREAEATECASEQGKFWEYTDAIYARTPSNNGLEDAQLFTVADELGLDRTKFDDCLSSKKYTSVVTTDANQAGALGGTGTPFVLVVDKNGTVVATIPGALPLTAVEGKASMTTILDQLL
jgi:protein-disulfide isomerase